MNVFRYDARSLGSNLTQTICGAQFLLNISASPTLFKLYQTFD